MNLRTLWEAARPLIVAAGVAAAAAGIARIDAGAQAPQQAPPPYTPPPAPRAQAPIDLTGIWASAITEDWQWRMITPAKGDFIAVPLNADGDRIGKAWDPTADVQGRNECKAFGAAGILRLPTRVRFEWVDDKTLKMDMDLGTQTRLLHFDPSARSGSSQPSGERSWQGYATAEWIDLPAPARGRGGTAADAGDSAAGGAAAPPTAAPEARGGAASPPTAAPAAGGDAAAAGRDGRGGRGARGGRGGGPPSGGLKVVTTNLREQYLRRNGVPVSQEAVVTEYFDIVPSPTGEQWLIVKTVVEDPRYLTQPYIVSGQFKKDADASKWNPTPCEVIPPAVDKKPRSE